MKGALGMECLSMKRLSGEDSFTGGPEDTLRKAPDMGISLYRGPFTAERNMESGRKLVYRGL